MRTAFIKALEDFISPEVMLITGDLGFGVLTDFWNKHPKQFLNAGVAEQNMTGLAAGMALTGKKVFTYSIANFNTLRALEQIRNDIAYHEVNVTVVSIGGGLAYGSLGISHHATEDLAIMRSIPNMKVFAPGDTREAYEITRRIIQEDMGPVYLRIGRAGEATLHSDESIRNLNPGKVLPLYMSEKKKIALLSTGGMLEVASQVHDMLLKELNLDSSVYSFHTIKPFDKKAVIDIVKKYEHIFTLEEHSVIGGFSSAVMESFIGEKGIDTSKIHSFALPSEFTGKVGDQNYLRDYYGISTEKIFNTIKKWM